MKGRVFQREQGFEIRERRRADPRRTGVGAWRPRGVGAPTEMRHRML
jgi:hypothetical protein